MKKKMYRIELKERDSIFTDMILEAAMSNGGTYLPLDSIAEAANFLCRKYPGNGSCHKVNLIGNVLTIDKGTTNVLILTEIEVIELDDEDAPTLNRYSLLNPQL